METQIQEPTAVEEKELQNQPQETAKCVYCEVELQRSALHQMCEPSMCGCGKHGLVSLDSYEQQKAVYNAS